nr:ScbR family autoregulator-binding transcription factor [Catellatospora tritici]
MREGEGAASPRGSRYLQERATRTRVAIIDAAAEVFDRHGYQGASLVQIMEIASVTKGGLYFHFASKEELAYAVIHEQFEVIQAGLPEGRGLQETIDLTHQVADELKTNPRMRGAIRLVIEHASFTAPMPDPYQAWIGVIRELLARAQQHGDVRQEVVVDDAARMVVGAFTGIQLTSEVLTGRKDLTERITQMWDLLLPALVPPRRRSRFVTGWPPART